MRARLATLLVTPLAILAASCGADGEDASRRTLVVPEQYDTIQAAVDAARPGDLVLIEPGTYHEVVVVDTSSITIRGLDRNTVVLDGRDELGNGIEITASGVAVENMTLTGYLFNGVMVNGADGEYRPDGAGSVDGYRIDHVTTYNNGLYGIYAFASRNGTISNSYASGHPDSGIYVGQCKPCNVVIHGVTAELNAIGYYGTNASGGVYVVESTFRGNRLGIAPNSQDVERLAPQEETIVAGNLVVGDGAAAAPEIVQGFFGGGIAVGGGTSNTVVRNRVIGHDAYGIGLVALGSYDPIGNRVEGNVLEDNHIDLLYAPDDPARATGNCFVGNAFRSSWPADIETVMPCAAHGPGPDVTDPDLPGAPPAPDGPPPAPPRQPTMADPRVMLAGAAGAPDVPDVGAIAVPERPLR